MSPRIVGCLSLSILAGVAAFAWTVLAGWGVLLGLVVYSFAGSLVLVLTSLAAAALFDGMPERVEFPARSRRGFATAHSG